METISAKNIVEGLMINDKRITKNLLTYWSFSASEGIIIEAVKKGADRQKMHEELRDISMKAWEAIQDGNPNPMADLLEENSIIGQYLKPIEITEILDAKNHIGNATKKALELAGRIQKI